jgi:hypothetical protein
VLEGFLVNSSLCYRLHSHFPRRCAGSGRTFN